MKNDSLSLNTYGIRSGSKVILMATPATDAAKVDVRQWTMYTWKDTLDDDALSIL